MLHLETISTSTLGLLIELQKLNSLKDTRLVGGTALSLQFGHRVSIDLDLFSNNSDYDFFSVVSEIKKKGFNIEIRKQSSNVLISMIDNVKVDIVNYPYPWLDESFCENGIVLATVKDIAAMKLAAITNRGTKKDFIDLYCLLKKYSLKQILSFYSAKYNDSSIFMVLKSLTYFEDAESDISPKILDKSITWEKVKETISKGVEQLSL